MHHDEDIKILLDAEKENKQVFDAHVHCLAKVRSRSCSRVVNRGISSSLRRYRGRRQISIIVVVF